MADKKFSATTAAAAALATHRFVVIDPALADSAKNQTVTGTQVIALAGGGGGGGGAPVDSPIFTGNPRAPTPSPGDGDTSIATTAFVGAAIVAGGFATTAFVGTTYAPKDSPVFTGNPTAPTPTPGDNDVSIATTAFVNTAVGAAGAPSTINVMSYGAIGDGTTNDAAAINAAAAAALAASGPLAAPTLFFPSGKVFRITSQLDLTGLRSIDCQGWIKVDYVLTTAPAIVVRTNVTGELRSGLFNFFGVYHNTLDYIALAQPLLQFSGLKGAHVTIGNCHYVEIFGNSATPIYNSTAFCKFNLGEIWRLEMRDDALWTGGAPNAWLNENQFFGGNLEILRIGGPWKAITGAVTNGAGLIRITSTAHGYTTGDLVEVIKVGGVTNANGHWLATVINANTFDLQGSTFAGTYTSGGNVMGPGGYRHNHNHFYSCDFEGAINVVWHGNHNSIIEGRFEKQGALINNNVLFSPGSWGNVVEQSAMSSGEIDIYNTIHATVTDYGLNFTGWSHFGWLDRVPILEVSPNTPMINGVTDIAGWNPSGVTAGLNYIGLTAGQTVYESPLIKVKPGDAVWFLMANDTAAWRPWIAAYDSDQRLINGADTAYPTRIIAPGFTYDTGTGRYSVPGNQGASFCAFVSGRTVAYIKAAMVTGAVGPFKVRGFGIYLLNPKGGGVESLMAPMYARQATVVPRLAAAPSSGFVRKGFQIELADGSGGYDCTFDFETTLSGAEASGQTILSVTANTGVLAGDVAGVLLNDGTSHWSTVSSTAAGTVTVAGALPSAAASASRIVFNRWALSTGGAAVSAAPRTIAASTGTQLDTDSTLIIDNAGTHTLTLLSAAAFPGKTVRVKTITANLVNSASSNVVPLAGGGAGSAILAAVDGAWADLQSDATNWIITGTSEGTAGATGATGAAGGMQTVANLAALKALATRPSPVLMEGYSAADDGGGGVWHWVVSDATTANDGTIVECTSGTAGRYFRIIQDGYLNVKWFGATGAAAGDDTAAMNAAADAVRASSDSWGSKGLYFPPNGVYVAYINPVDFSGISNIKCDGWLAAYGTFTGPAYTMGQTSAIGATKIEVRGFYYINVAYDALRDPMVRLQGMNGSYFWTNYCNSWIEVFADSADNVSTAYSEFHIGKTFRLELRSGQTPANAGSGWINSNQFYGGTLTQLRIGGPWKDPSSITNNGGLIRVAITAHGYTTGEMVELYKRLGGHASVFGLITVIDANTFDIVGSTFVGPYTAGDYMVMGPAGYPHNCNDFWNPDIEDTGAVIHIQGQYNRILNARMEVHPDSFCAFGPQTMNNSVEQGNSDHGVPPNVGDGLLDMTVLDYSGGKNRAGWAKMADGFQVEYGVFIGTATGSVNALVVATPSPPVTVLTVGKTYVVKANVANTTTTPTININGLGAKTIVKRVSTALAAGDYLANMYLNLIYDGTNMVLTNPVVN